jgi:hypothetical protein
MPDLSGLPALDVAIGLAFIYFVLSIVCSAVNEGIAATLRLRAKDLERGIRSMLGDEAMVKRFYDDPRIQALHQRLRLRKDHPTKPSYIPSRVFALAVMDLLSPPAPAISEQERMRGARQSLRGMADEVPLKSMLADVANDARSRIDALASSLERSFDEVMDRVSGWYKRRVQWILLVVALVVVGAANVDSFAIGESLFRDDAVRSAVVARAADQQSPVACDKDDPAPTTLDGVADCVDGLAELGLPLGWTKAATPDSAAESAFKALGLLITAFALTLGAPFWFDTLGKLARLRGTGNREGTLKDDDRAPSDRDERPTG